MCVTIETKFDVIFESSFGWKRLLKSPYYKHFYSDYSHSFVYQCLEKLMLSVVLSYIYMNEQASLHDVKKVRLF